MKRKGARPNHQSPRESCTDRGHQVPEDRAQGRRVRGGRGGAGGEGEGKEECGGRWGQGCEATPGAPAKVGPRVQALRPSSTCRPLRARPTTASSHGLVRRWYHGRTTARAEVGSGQARADSLAILGLAMHVAILDLAGSIRGIRLLLVICLSSGLSPSFRGVLLSLVFGEARELRSVVQRDSEDIRFLLYVLLVRKAVIPWRQRRLEPTPCDASE